MTGIVAVLSDGGQGATAARIDMGSSMTNLKHIGALGRKTSKWPSKRALQNGLCKRTRTKKVTQCSSVYCFNTFGNAYELCRE